MITPGEPLLEVRDLHLRAGRRILLAGVSVRVRAGEIVTLIGPNGAGKTTLIRAALGLQSTPAGCVRLAAGVRVGYMPQRVAIDEVLPLSVARFLSLVPGSDEQAAREALTATGVTHLLEQPIQHISGGELQRVLLARALLRKPELLVLDEPAQGVDVGGQSAFYELIRRLRNRLGCGVLLSSHDLHLVMAASDQVLCLNQHVCCEGHPEAVSRHPEYLALFGEGVSPALAVYQHAHDHRHDLHGDVVPTPEGNASPERHPEHG